MPRILLIDDNAIFRSLLRQQLERAGHEFLEAAEGTEALRIHQQQPADLIVCDVFMPGKDGLDTIRDLHKTSRVPIVAISGNGPAVGFNLLDMARDLGAVRILRKPFDTETLLEAMREVLPDRS